MWDFEEETTDVAEEVYRVLQFVCFRIGKQEIALPISQVREVMPTPPITPLPLSSASIMGLSNVRGNVIAIVDLEKKLNFLLNEETESQENKFILVVQHDDFRAGILLPQVPNTLDVAENLIDYTADMLQQNLGDTKNYVSGIIRQESNLILLLNLSEIMSEENIDL